MRTNATYLLAAALTLAGAPALAQSSPIHVQCPGDADGDAIPDPGAPGFDPKVKCVHLAAGDGFITMADGTPEYTFGFSDATGTMGEDVMMYGMLGAAFPAPTLALDEGDDLYLNLTNVGMMMRPDLFDPHSVHFHGFPQAAAVFDGVPESSAVIRMGATFTYYYKLVEPGTYFYHCHVEATEHLQMGMIGNLYVRPKQNGQSIGGYTKFAYNDGDGSTGYDFEYPIQLSSMDPTFHELELDIQPPAFAVMRDRYGMINGRGYPDTIAEGALTPPGENGGKPSQVVSSAIGTPTSPIPAGSRVLLRISNVSTTRFFTLATTGIPMRVVGHDARLLRGPDGKDLTYRASSVTLGGGETLDVILETAGLQAGTYFLYTTNLNYLSNDAEDYGGMMTEIVIG